LFIVLICVSFTDISEMTMLVILYFRLPM